MRCAKDGCPKPATFGSRCALHWLRRKATLRKLCVPASRPAGWRLIEPIFAEGLEQRAQIISLGEVPGLADLSFAKRLKVYNMARLQEVVDDADAFIRRQHAGADRSEEE